MKKKILSVLLSLCMVCMLLPTTALAETETPHTHCICGATHSDVGDHNSAVAPTWLAVNDSDASGKIENAELNAQVTAGTSETPKYYYLTKDVELSYTWTVSTGTTAVLCLNGHTIKTTNNGYDAITVQSSRTFTLTDCKTGSEQGKITHDEGKDGRGVYVYDGGTFNMYGGSITRNNTINGYSGGGVYVNSGTFNMYGGSITGNSTTTDYNATSKGGGVYVNGSSAAFNMSGSASITNNAAFYGGGVYVEQNGTFNMAGGSITNNVTSESYGVNGPYPSGGGVHVENGTFKMSAGTITNNTSAKNGGGVYVGSHGEFTMSNSASITGNTASDYGDGGGVFVNEGGTFQMSDDSRITGNTGFRGGGVSVDRNYGTTYNPGAFTMSSGNITNNNAEYGGGVYISGKFTMSGGKISSNRAAGNSGGVHMNTDSTFTVSGAPKITDNTLKSGTTNNVRLSEGTTTKPDATITIGDLSTGASIGVTTEKTLTTGSSVTIATGAVGDVDYTKIFKSDAASQGYVVIKDGNDLKLSTHRHSWSYTANGGATITATCGNAGCTSTPYSETLTISASNATYDGTAKPANLSSQSGLVSDLKTVEVNYQKKTGENNYGTATGTAPTNAGTYKASITVGGKTASVEYTIGKANGSITTAPAANTLTYTGSGQALVTAGAGTGTVWYSLDNTNWNTVIPTGTNAGSYTVYYKLVGDVNHNDAAGGSVDVTIDKADPTVTAPTAKTLTYTGSAQELVNAGSTNGGTMEYKVGPAGDWTDTVPTGTAVGSYNVYYKVVGNSNYNNSAEAGPVAVTISKATPGGSNAAKYIRYNDTAEKTFTAADFDLDLAGAFALKADSSVTDSSSVLAAEYPKFEGGAIKVKLKDSLSFVANTTVTIPVTFTPSVTTNYQTKNYTLTITLSNKDDVSGNITFNNGELAYTGTGLDYEAATITDVSGGTWTYTYAAGSSPASLDGSGKPLTVGTYTVTATYEDSAHLGAKSATLTVKPKTVTVPAADSTAFTYNGNEQTYTLTANAAYTVTGNKQTNAGTYNVTVALADTTNTKWNDDTTTAKTYTFTINKATPTGDPTYTPITTSGKTLADAALTKNAGWPAGGTLKWVQADGTTELDSSTVVVANTSYKWLYTPADTTNHNTLTGSITPYVVSYSGGGGGSSSPTYKVESEVSNNTDGNVSFSKSNAKKGDTVTITVTPDRYYKVDGVTVKDKNGKEIAVTDNGDGTFTFQMPDSKVAVEPIFSWDNPFTDVAENAYYTPAVEWALKNDVTNGTGDGTTFSPNVSCTRAQIVTFLWRAAGCPEPAGISSFTDVSADAYYAKAVAWAVEQGITNGTGDGTTFSPDATCTRSQGVTFLYRSAGSPEISDDIAFNDVTTGSYYSDAVVWATQNGVTDGTGNGKFSPVRDCTRAQIVTFLYRWMVK